MTPLKPSTHCRQTVLLLKPVTNQQQSRLSPIRSTLSPVWVTNREQLEFDSLPWSTLSPTPSTLLPKRHGRLSTVNRVELHCVASVLLSSFLACNSYDCVAPYVDIILHTGRFWAKSAASESVRWCCLRSSWTVLSHVMRDDLVVFSNLPEGRLTGSSWHLRCRPCA